jgi:hypothetical protein
VGYRAKKVGGNVRKGGFVLVVSLLTIVSGCSSSGNHIGNGASASPGHSTPEDAVDGYLTAFKAGTSSWCSYIDPASQGTCEAGLTEGSVGATGKFTIKGEVIQGTEALVIVVGSLCVHENLEETTINYCSNNSNTDSGMPSGSLSFADAYAAVTNAKSSVLSPVPCVEVNGLWYENAEETGSSTTETTVPATTTPTTPPTT